MRLQQKLDEHKQRFLAGGKASPEMLGIMQRSTEQLRGSGILQGVLKPGQKAPSFQLPNQDGVLVAFVLPEDLRGVYRKFGIDLPRSDGDDSWALPMPARFIIDRQGTIRSATADPDYTIRPEPDETVETLRKLASLPASA